MHSGDRREHGLSGLRWRARFSGIFYARIGSDGCTYCGTHAHLYPCAHASTHARSYTCTYPYPGAHTHSYPHTHASSCECRGLSSTIRPCAGSRSGQSAD